MTTAAFRLFPLLAVALLSCARTGAPQGEHTSSAPSPEDPQSSKVEPNPFVAAPENNAAPVLAPAPIVAVGEVIKSQPLPDYSAEEPIVLQSGGIIPVTVVGNERYIPVEFTFDEANFTSLYSQATRDGLSAAERNGRIKSELIKVTGEISRQFKMAGVRYYPEVGYATALVPLAGYQSSLGKTTKLSRRVLMNPRVVSPMDERAVRKLNDEIAQGLAGNPREATEAFSGLKRIGAPQFLEKAEKEAGAKIDGSGVKVGVTDTGITFNHPAFRDDKGESRIIYMKDFTGEGRAFFAFDSRFEISPATEKEASGLSPEEVLLLSADYFEPTVGTQFAPVADKLSKVEKMPLLVSKELRERLLANPGAKLGAMSEASFQKEAESVDLNMNGKVNDKFWTILVPDAEKKTYQVYLDLTATVDAAGGVIADFRKSVAVGDWNATHQVVKSHSEAFGFEIKKETIQKSDQSDVEVMTASIVGFDPGNHGTHVSGIIGARKTISNDADDTYARGVAPAAQLMMNRVCSNNGGCQATSAIIDLAKNGAEVVNMSLGGLSEYNDGYGVQETVVNRLTYLFNTLFVISAGNSGPGKNTVGSPSTARLSLSVGASASQALIERQYQWLGTGRKKGTTPAEDFMLFFSSRGPTAAGGFKPNIAAPGTELSAIQLNAAPGSRAGLDVYWGTSMAAPAATGAVALLIDAAKKYNAANPSQALPLDAVTLRRVIIESARPFDVSTFNPKTGAKTQGQYTWIDEGAGMIDLPRAWEALKKARDSRLPSAVSFVETSGKKVDVELDYQVRLARKHPNGLAYDGSEEAPTDGQGGTEARFATGIWLDHRDQDSLIPVHVVRTLPSQLVKRSDVGDLAAQLNTSMDEFEFETIFYGAHRQWLKVGTQNVLDCWKSPTAKLSVVGQGAVVVPRDPSTPDSKNESSVLQGSALNVCVNRNILASLPAGDHGALIHAYRVVQGKRESHSAFTVPVYITVPHKTLAGSAKLDVEGEVESFRVARNYVSVPEGTSLVEVTLEVPPAEVSDTHVKGCASVELMALEGKNTLKPKELKSRTAAIVANCDANGRPLPDDKRVLKIARSSPTAGIWDLHVFGRYNFASSKYKLKVEYAKVEASKTSIAGAPEALNGELEVKVLESSFAVTPAGEKSSLVLNSLVQKLKSAVKNQEEVVVANADGAQFRKYSEGVESVTFATGGAPTNDIDLVVMECEEALINKCKAVASSGGATDVESATFVPTAGKFYAAVVSGYEVPEGKEAFDFTETQQLKTSEEGKITIENVSAEQYKVVHSFDIAASALLKLPEFLSGKYALAGELAIRSADRSTIAALPVEIKAQ